MKTTPYLDNLAHVITMLDDELLGELLVRLRSELAARGKFDAANYVGRARSCMPSNTPTYPEYGPSSPSSR